MSYVNFKTSGRSLIAIHYLIAAPPTSSMSFINSHRKGKQYAFSTSLSAYRANKGESYPLFKMKLSLCHNSYGKQRKFFN